MGVENTSNGKEVSGKRTLASKSLALLLSFYIAVSLFHL